MRAAVLPPTSCNVSPSTASGPGTFPRRFPSAIAEAKVQRRKTSPAYDLWCLATSKASRG